MKQVSATFSSPSFNCPHCESYSHQLWKYYEFETIHDFAELNPTSLYVKAGPLEKEEIPFAIAKCQKCSNYTIWVNKKMVFPKKSLAPLPAMNMPEDVLKDYNEARSIFEDSPKAAAALLRLAIQKLCKDLGGKGKDINDDIGFLVKEGLPERVQKALDIVRVVGNNAVHPGKISIDDNPDVALALFKMINVIVDTMITQPLEIDELFSSLPEGAKNQIKTRDLKEPGKQSK